MESSFCFTNSRLQNKMVFPLLHILLSMHWMVSTTAESGVTKCEVPPVYEGGETNLTCLFSEDVRLKKKNIAIVRKSLHQREFQTDEIIVKCSWKDSTSLSCEDPPFDFKFYGVTGKEATIGIRYAKKDVAGVYACQVVPAEPDSFRPCVLRIKEKAPQQMPNLCCQPTTVDISTLVILVVAAITIPVLIVCLRKRWWKPCLRCCGSCKGREGTAGNNADVPAGTAALIPQGSPDVGSAISAVTQEMREVQNMLRTLNDSVITKYEGIVNGMSEQKGILENIRKDISENLTRRPLVTGLPATRVQRSNSERDTKSQHPFP